MDISNIIKKELEKDLIFNGEKIDVLKTLSIEDIKEFLSFPHVLFIEH